jgi:hypothetical protein
MKEKVDFLFFESIDISIAAFISKQTNTWIPIFKFFQQAYSLMLLLHY